MSTKDLEEQKSYEMSMQDHHARLDQQNKSRTAWQIEFVGLSDNAACDRRLYYSQSNLSFLLGRSALNLAVFAATIIWFSHKYII